MMKHSNPLNFRFDLKPLPIKSYPSIVLVKIYLAFFQKSFWISLLLKLLLFQVFSDHSFERDEYE